MVAEHVFVEPEVPAVDDLLPENEPIGFRRGEFIEDRKSYKKKLERLMKTKSKSIAFYGACVYKCYAKWCENDSWV